MDDERWTITELCAEVAAELARGYRGAANGQVRAVPDERGVRYYNTLGLLDRPVAMRGRTALYGRRHLAQVVAIKRMQEAGRSLAEIQATLPTVDDRGLAELAGIAVEIPQVAPPRQRAGFWREVPDVDAPPPPPPAPAPLELAPRAARAAAAVGSIAAPVRPSDDAAPDGFAVRVELILAPGVTLSITPTREPTDADAAALRAAAATLLTELARRRLVSPPPLGDDAAADAPDDR